VCVQETQPPSDFGKTSVEIGVMKDLLDNNRLLFEVGYDTMVQALSCTVFID